MNLRVAVLILAVALSDVWPQCGTLPPSHLFGAPIGITIAPGGDPAAPERSAFVTIPNQLGIRRIDLDNQVVAQDRIAVGRRLGSIVSHVGSAGVVDKLWAVDREAGAVVSVDPVAAFQPTVAGTVVFTGAVNSVTMTPPQLVPGQTGTQDWTVTYRQSLSLWEVSATGGGVQRGFASTGYSYSSDLGEVTFTITQSGPNPPSDGDTFRFSTDNGVRVAALMTSGASALLPFDSNLAIATFASPAQLTVFDLSTGIPARTFALSSGAIPARLEAAPDGSAVYLADLGNPVLYRLDTAGVVPGWTLETLPVPVPMRDVAVSGDGARVMAMPAGADDVFVWTHPGFVPVSYNGTIPGFNPVSFPGPIRALAGARQPHVTHGTGTPTYPVLVTTHAGNVFFLSGSTGCIDFAASSGAALTALSFRDVGQPSAPVFNPFAFFASRCGGRVQTENWTIVYDGVQGGWVVTGSLSGRQSRLLHDGIPYLTDRGELTFEIDSALPGSGAEDDGDTFFMSVGNGLAPAPLGNVPDRPVFYTQQVDGIPVEYALIPDVAGDDVQQVDVGNQVVVATYR